jgi:hypothetical protein
MHEPDGSHGHTPGKPAWTRALSDSVPFLSKLAEAIIRLFE